LKIFKDSQDMKRNRIRQLPAGIKDYLFDEAQRRRSVESHIIRVLRQYDYREIITPTFEYFDVFSTAGRNGFVDKIYRFLDRDGNLVALRSDFTAQVARIVASKNSALEFPVRLYYSGKIFRFEELHAGRSRESWQVGFELIGDTGAEGEVEVLEMVVNMLRSLAVTGFQINLGTIEYFNGIVEHADLRGDQLDEIKYLIDHKDADTLSRLLEGSGLPGPTRAALLGMVSLHGQRQVLDRAEKLATNSRSRHAVAELTAVYDRLTSSDLAGNVVIDLSDVEGMGYYSGLMIKAYVQGVGYEVGSGGRYDNLLDQFGFDCPAVGFSFDVDRLVEGVHGRSSVRG
jgi:ATP phosphoribosyltransferase regulatory subunit